MTQVLKTEKDLICHLLKQEKPQRQDAAIDQIFSLLNVVRQLKMSQVYRVMHQALTKDFLKVPVIEGNDPPHYALNTDQIDLNELAVSDTFNFAVSVANALGCYDAADWFKLQH